jgi:flagellar biosynthesis GTPase FlhF
MNPAPTYTTPLTPEGAAARLRAAAANAPAVSTLLDQIKQRHHQLTAAPASPPLAQIEAYCHGKTPNDASVWELAQRLEMFGLLPPHAEQVAQQAARLRRSTSSPPGPAEEIAAVSAVLTAAWRQPPRPAAAPQWHVLVGPPGVGKSTGVCKWLAQAVLMAGCKAQVWRLDGATANAAEALSVYAEVLGVPVSRSWPAETGADAQVHFVDVPGVDWRDESALNGLLMRLPRAPGLQIHLVLNGAYETARLLEQVRAFSRLPIADLIFTHLDEETRWGKLWNFVFGTKYAVGFLSAGQNVPGEFRAATPQELLPRRWA